MIKWLILFIFIFLGSTLCFVVTEKYFLNSDKINALPTFTLHTLYDEQKIFNSQNLNSKVQVLNFFASWCVSCQAEHALLLSYKDVIDIYGINYLDTPEQAKKWLNTNDNPYKIVAIDYKGKLGRLLHITGVPESFVINGNGKIILHIAQPLTKEIIQKQILPLLISEKRG